MESQILVTEQNPQPIQYLGQPLKKRSPSKWWIILFLIAAGIGLFAYALNSRVSDDSSQKTFVVVPKQGFRTIAANLYDKNFIKYPKVFEVYGLLTGRSAKAQAGVYSLSSNMTLKEVFNIITFGKTNIPIVTFRIKEGWSIQDIQDELVKNNLTTTADFNTEVSKQLIGFKFGSVNPNTLEGYLYPDTYFLPKSSVVKSLIQKALENFQAKVSTTSISSAQSQGRTFTQVLTLASILEKEVRTQQDKEIVAGIFMNRFSNRNAFAERCDRHLHNSQEKSFCNLRRY